MSAEHSTPNPGFTETACTCVGSAYIFHNPIITDGSIFSADGKGSV